MAGHLKAHDVNWQVWLEKVTEKLKLFTSGTLVKGNERRWLGPSFDMQSHNTKSRFPSYLLQFNGPILSAVFCYAQCLQVFSLFSVY